MFPTEPFYDRDDVSDSSATRVGAEETRFVVCLFIKLTKAYDSLTEQSSAQYSPVLEGHRMGSRDSSIPRWHASIRAARRQCVLGVWFAVKLGLCQGCVLAPLLLNIIFAPFISEAYTRFNAEKDIMDALVHLRKKKGAGGRGKVTAGEQVLVTPLWGMLYVDDAGVVSQSPEQLRKMMRAVVVVSMAFGLTISHAKNEIMCLRRKGMPESTATFSVEAAGEVHNHTDEFVYIKGNVSHNTDLSIEVNRRIRKT